MEEAETAACSDNQAFASLDIQKSESHIKTQDARIAKDHSNSLFASDPDLALIKLSFEERTKNAL
jgi:hypothetical protein